MTEIRDRTAKVNGIELHVTEAGPSDGPPVICLHGFPETSYSWRHTLPALAAAGWHAVAPDQRGYGTSSRPPNVDDYGSDQLAADALGLVDETGYERAVFLGHDWGALAMWDLARMFPERCRALVAVSVPVVDWPGRPTELFRKLAGDRFFYMSYFQEVGPAEAELEADVRAGLRRILYSGSADGVDNNHPDLPADGTGVLDTLGDPPDALPGWLTEEDVDVYADAFCRSGFFGPVSYYRNLDANYERLRELPVSRLSMPVWFIGGDHDIVLRRDPGGVERMQATMPGFRGATILPGVGHWTQQEAPTEFNEALLGFLATL